MDTNKYSEKLRAIQYPNHPKRPAFPKRDANCRTTPDELRKYADDVEKFQAERAVWLEDQKHYEKAYNEILAEFEDAVIKELGIEGHPKAGKLYARAWSRGHANGLSDVWEEACDLVDLIK